VATPFYRLHSSTSDQFGDLAFQLNLSALPGGLQMHVGETWYFQAWYRDPLAGGSNTNTSDALAVPWCP
jgi:hypothetical protein